MKITNQNMIKRVATVAEVHSDAITLQVPDGKGDSYYYSCRPHGFKKLKEGDFYLVATAAEAFDQFFSLFTVPLYPCTQEGGIIGGKLSEEEIEIVAPLTIIEKTDKGIKIVVRDPWGKRHISHSLTPRNWERLEVGELLPAFIDERGTLKVNPIL